MQSALFSSALLMASTQAINTLQAAQMFEGIVEGALQTEQITSVASCIKDVDPIAADLTSAIESLEKKDVADILSGINDIGKALEASSTILEDCKSISAQDKQNLEKMGDAFRHPQSLAYQVGKDLLVNGVDIYSDLNSGLGEFKSGDFNSAGNHFGEAGALVLFGKMATEANFSAPQENGVDAKEIAEIIGGIVLGALEEEIPDVSTCISDVDSSYKMIMKAVAEFEKHSTSGTEAGVADIGRSIQLIVKDIKDCREIPADLQKLEKAAASFVSPWSFIYHAGKDILLNGKQIYHEITDAQQQWKNKSYTAFGKDIGEALAQVIF